VVGYVYGAIEGTDYMALRGPAAVLHDVIVAPDERRGGVGRALVGAMLEAFTAREAPRVVLSTAARNEPARAFFEGLGFRETMVELTRELP
jgi:ribosomal protein S18 acetylase RimI-like enzyme